MAWSAASRPTTKPTTASRSSRSSLGRFAGRAWDFAERAVAVECEPAGHVEHALCDHVRRDLRRAAADADRLAHQEVDAPLREIAVVFGPRRAGAAGQLVRDRRAPRLGQAD